MSNGNRGRQRATCRTRAWHRLERWIAQCFLGLGCLGLALLAGRADAAEAPSYGAELEGFAYPYPVKSFAFESQQQALRMAYLDVAARGKANGRTVLLLHG